VASERLRGQIERIARGAALPYTLVEGKHRYELMREARCALSTCGTVILELALFHTPTVVTYKIPYLNYVVGRYLFKISLPHFSLPNIIMKGELFPEHVDKRISSATLVEMAQRVMGRTQQIVEGCEEMRQRLSLEKSRSASEELYELFLL